MKNTHGGARSGAGRPPQKPVFKRTLIQITKDQDRKITNQAKAHRCSRAEIIRCAIDHYMATE